MPNQWAPALEWLGAADQRRTIRIGDNCGLAVLSRIAAVCGGDSIWWRHVRVFALNGSDERARASLVSVAKHLHLC
jgi:hypothetical protein